MGLMPAMIPFHSFASAGGVAVPPLNDGVSSGHGFLLRLEVSRPILSRRSARRLGRLGRPFSRLRWRKSSRALGGEGVDLRHPQERREEVTQSLANQRAGDGRPPKDHWTESPTPPGAGMTARRSDFCSISSQRSVLWRFPVRAPIPAPVAPRKPPNRLKTHEGRAGSEPTRAVARPLVLRLRISGPERSSGACRWKRGRSHRVLTRRLPDQ